MAMWVIGCVALALACLCIFTFNDLIMSHNRVRAAWSGSISSCSAVTTWFRNW